MTRTHKWTVHESKPNPKYFSHNGFLNNNPNNLKKNGAGKNNWGIPGDELKDIVNDDTELDEAVRHPRGSNKRFNESKFNDVQHNDFEEFSD